MTSNKMKRLKYQLILAKNTDKDNNSGHQYINSIKMQKSNSFFR